MQRVFSRVATDPPGAWWKRFLEEHDIRMECLLGGVVRVLGTRVFGRGMALALAEGTIGQSRCLRPDSSLGYGCKGEWVNACIFNVVNGVNGSWLVQGSPRLASVPLSGTSVQSVI